MTALLLAACAAPADGTEDATESGEDALSASKFAGAYTSYGAEWKDGLVFSLVLRTDKTFAMTVRGQYGCGHYGGYVCPETWSDGRTGWTDVGGSWKVSGTKLSLQPTGDGAKADPLAMTIGLNGDKAEVDGTIKPNRNIHATMDVDALFSAKHSVKDADLDGTWKVSTPDGSSSQPMLSGSMMSVTGDQVHTITFDKAKKSWTESRSGDPKPRKPLVTAYTVAGNGAGTGAGVIFLDNGRGSFDTVKIESAADDKLTLVVAGDRKIILDRQ
ncbi:hypothetical protein AKJ09_06293 [Labilithrix luteola]|uniref:Uncharacterized protein n=1 Tax=Labilithrix luteola TaxID=1391654 RepID=A0A0K1Q2L6_9BACT|nr:hypothetical protein AKJ09_06293 [Labilithrix luteola]